MNTIAAGEFKEKCLKIMDHVFETHEEILITKRGHPIAKLVPVEITSDPFGICKDSVVIQDDIISYKLDDVWNVND